MKVHRCWDDDIYFAGRVLPSMIKFTRETFVIFPAFTRFYGSFVSAFQSDISPTKVFILEYVLLKIKSLKWILWHFKIA